MFGAERRDRRRGGSARGRPGDVPSQGGGGNQIALFQDPREPQRQHQRRQTTAARIRDALTDDRLSLHTQPIRSLASGGIERYELLLRMTSEDGELLPAASFIEAAERSGMVQELDRWVVARALEMLAGASAGEAALTSRQHLRRLAGRHLGARVHRTPARRRRVDPARCTFEITETARVYDYDAPPASPTASPSSAARSRSTTTAPASGPSTT